MTPMLQTLYANPEKGFLHAEFYWNFTGPVTIQYGPCFEELERFARQPSEPHLEAWKKFNRPLARTEVLEFGMKPIWSNRIISRCSMAIYQNLVSVAQWNM
jgi:hypothetical protein